MTVAGLRQWYGTGVWLKLQPEPDVRYPRCCPVWRSQDLSRPTGTRDGGHAAVGPGDSLVCCNDDQSVYLDRPLASVEAFAAAACWILPDHTAACWVHVTTWRGKMSMPEGEFRSISLGHFG